MSVGSSRPWIIIVIAILLVTVILFLGNQSFKASETATFDEFNQRQLVLAEEATSGMELYFEIVAGDLGALTKRWGIQQSDEPLARAELKLAFDVLEPLGVNDVAVLDADGFMRFNAAASQLEGADLSWRRYYQEAKERKLN